MMLDKFSLAILRYLLCLQLLSGWCLAKTTVREVNPSTTCIDNANASSMLDVKCSNRIEVVSIYYGHRQEISSECSQSNIQECHTFLSTGQELKTSQLYNFCSYSLYGCNFRIGQLPTPDCSISSPFNFMLMEYRCIPGKDFIDLCGHDANITSTVKHLAYFRKGDDNQFQNCTCSIQGLHTLTAVNAGVLPSSKNDCKPLNLLISRTNSNGIVNTTNVSQADQQLIKEDFKELDFSKITLITNCTHQAPPVWFKIKPVDGETVRIQCGESINNSSNASSPNPSSPATTTDSTSEVTQLNTTEVENRNTSSTMATTSLSNTNKEPQLPISTDQMNTTSTIMTTLAATPTSTITNTLADTSTKEDEQSTLPFTGENTKVPVIVGSVIGALVLIIIFIIIGVLVHRRKRREKSPSGLGTVVNNTYNYDEVNAGNHQTFPNNAFGEGTPDYSSVGESKTTNDNNDRFMFGESSTDYDILKPATVFQTFSYQNKKATGEQHNDVTLYDHPKNQTKGGHNTLPGDDVKDSDYDVLESKPNLNSSFDKVETLDDDTYNHVDGNHKDPSDTTDQVMPKTETKNVTESAPEYATVNKLKAGQEQTGSAAGDGNNAKLDSTGNAKDANIYHILEEPTTQEIQTGSEN